MKNSAVIRRYKILHFLAILYYFGVCKLPSKCNYWQIHRAWPTHILNNDLNMTQDSLLFLWRHLHVSPSSNVEDVSLEEDEDDASDDMEELVEQHLECV